LEKTSYACFASLRLTGWLITTDGSMLELSISFSSLAGYRFRRRSQQVAIALLCSLALPARPESADWLSFRSRDFSRFKKLFQAAKVSRNFRLGVFAEEFCDGRAYRPSRGHIPKCKSQNRSSI